MNKRNVDALAKLLTEYNQGTAEIDPRGLAFWLAERSALLPSAISEPQRNFLGQAPADQIVPMLEKIARGES